MLLLVVGEFQWARALFAAGQREDVFCSSETESLVEEYQPILGDRVTVFVRGADEASKLREAMERLDPKEGKQRANILEPVLDRSSSQTPARSSLEVSAVSVESGCLSADDVRCDLSVLF